MREPKKTKNKGSYTWKTGCVSATWMKLLKKKMVYNIKSLERPKIWGAGEAVKVLFRKNPPIQKDQN